MTPEWRPADSSRIVAEAYDVDAEAIFVRFPDGTEWCYEACPPDVWEAFTAPGQSRGEFIHEVLDHKPNHRYSG
ncbi:MAG: KTSC domain-containing protein [Actinobacteria bacterium]|nr:KTSC domain-containing protein [Actinomycetota bacterium]